MWRKVMEVPWVRPKNEKRRTRNARRWILPLAATLLASELLASPVSSMVSYDPQQKCWTMGNGLISIVYHFDDVRGAIQLASLKDLSAQEEWPGDATQPVFHVRFVEDGQGEQSDSRSGWRLEGWTARDIDSQTSELIIRLVDARDSDGR